MADEPGPSKKVRYDPKKLLTDEELLNIFEEGSDSQEDPYANDSEDDPDYTSPSDSEEKQSGLLIDMNNSTKHIDYFNLLTTDEFFDMLCTRANKHAINLIALSDGEESRIARWIDVTPTEMRKFLGFRNRFLIILRALQFEDTDSQEPPTQYGKIKPLVDFFSDKMKEIYYPSRELSIDESMVLWRGRLKFHQYVKGKRHKFGIKLYQLCEPNGTVLKLIVYTGSANPEISGNWTYRKGRIGSYERLSK
ncbi:hypothetical protein NQ314_001062 [Rhamnusium bicolor]|uniref:PiggyBac transposable element-derived protein domain-containing protein n=1 Tax=Rhamnusium bicolor TaxID=1586634 RepID=A0AAV8ZT43_9CUCU|nr:hypothetical protein NQ314_001062 [Rhamnusium bicolor]